MPTTHNVGATLVVAPFAPTPVIPTLKRHPRRLNVIPTLNRHPEAQNVIPAEAGIQRGWEGRRPQLLSHNARGLGGCPHHPEAQTSSRHTNVIPRTNVIPAHKRHSGGSRNPQGMGRETPTTPYLQRKGIQHPHPSHPSKILNILVQRPNRLTSGPRCSRCPPN